MTKAAIMILLTSAIAAAQPSISPGKGATEVARTIATAMERRDAALYASVFAPTGSWDGSHGQIAGGRVQLEPTIAEFFAQLDPNQPFHLSEFDESVLSATLVMVDVYSTRQPPIDRGIPPTSPFYKGRLKNDFRTTLLIENKDGTWLVKAARVADLRERETEPKRARRTSTVPTD